MNLDVQYEKKVFYCQKKKKEKPEKKTTDGMYSMEKYFVRKSKKKRQQMAMVPIYYTCSFIVSLKIQLTVFKMAHAP